MENKQQALLDAVKMAVAKSGISGVSTRLVGDLAGVNDAYIYRFFKDKEDMLFQAYKQENGAIFKKIIFELDEAHGLPLSFSERARVSFEKVWRFILSDAERINYCVTYYHSSYFLAAMSYHEEEMGSLYERLGAFFDSQTEFKHTMYALCTILYDAGHSVTLGRAEDNEETENFVFKTAMAILLAHTKKPEEK